MSSIEQQITERPTLIEPARLLLRARDLLEARPLITARGIQIALGVLWLLDGLLQFKSFMYTHALITEVFGPVQHGQPAIVAGPMRTIDNFYGRDLALWNTLAAEIQVAIGLALMLSRRTVRPALLVSFGWAFAVWWFGEGFGGLTATTLPSPLMGAPGAVILYALVGLIAWPSTRESAGRAPSASGPLGERGGRAIFSALWLLSAGLWLVNVNRGSEATRSMLHEMAEASPSWLRGAQNWAASQAAGHGTAIAFVLAGLSIAIAIAVWNRRLSAAALALSIVISLAYWVLGQSIGGPFWSESATDVNAAPLFVLLALCLLAPRSARSPQPARAYPASSTASRT